VTELIIRFLIGGALVSMFSLTGSLFKPTSFGGLFGAAPSVALATLALTIAHEGRDYASVECRSMMAGAIALAGYSLTVKALVAKLKIHALPATLSASIVWFLLAFGLWRTFLH